jgi:membrane carboxypeptidase/penicillin-binding protein
VVETARKLGIESHLNPYPAIALGASEVTPLELTRAYGVLAAGGFRPELRSTMWLATRDGGRMKVEESRSRSKLTTGRLDSGAGSLMPYDPAETYLVTSALRGAVERGTGQGLRNRGFQGDVAAKSGTTNDYRDGWFVGYTPNLVVGVWVGFDHGRQTELTGAGMALPIFAQFLTEAVGSDGRRGTWGSEGFIHPDGLEMVHVDQSTGLRGGWGCSGDPEWFLQGTAPLESCRGIQVDGRTFRILAEEGAEGALDALRLLFRNSGRRFIGQRERDPGDRQR